MYKILSVTAGLQVGRIGKGGTAYIKGYEEEFWVCASGACDYYPDRKDGVPYEDAR